MIVKEKWVVVGVKDMVGIGRLEGEGIVLG